MAGFDSLPNIFALFETQKDLVGFSALAKDLGPKRMSQLNQMAPQYQQAHPEEKLGLTALYSRLNDIHQGVGKVQGDSAGEYPVLPGVRRG